MSSSEKTCTLFRVKGQRQNNEISNEKSLFKAVLDCERSLFSSKTVRKNARQT